MFENKAQMLKIDDTISSHFLEMHTNINHTLIVKYSSSCANTDQGLNLEFARSSALAILFAKVQVTSRGYSL